jgi:hypothetical protein
MRQQIRVNFTGKTTLDNGMTVGVLVGLDGENVAKSDSTSQVNRAYGFFNGKFGEVRVGEVYSALVTDCILDPGNVTSNFGVNSPEESFRGVYGSFQQNASVILATSAPGISADNENLSGVSLNTAYALGPGISLEGQIAYTNANYGSLSGLGLSIPVPAAVGVNASQVHSWEIDLGTGINF